MGYSHEYAAITGRFNQQIDIDVIKALTSVDGVKDFNQRPKLLDQAQKAFAKWESEWLDENTKGQSGGAKAAREKFAQEIKQFRDKLNKAKSEKPEKPTNFAGIYMKERQAAQVSGIIFALSALDSATTPEEKGNAAKYAISKIEEERGTLEVDLNGVKDEALKAKAEKYIKYLDELEKNLGNVVKDQAKKAKG